MDHAADVLSYLAVFAAVAGGYLALRRRGEARSRRALAEAEATGLTEPASLHPVIAADKCLGCAACVAACPEGRILGLVNGRAALVEPTNCIGHGACAAACPTDAISLVFGGARRGVEIPRLGADFQTSAPGIYIAGELGGMGLIRNAVEQGRQAMAEIARRPRAPDGMLDALIVGAGPAGIAASLTASEAGLRVMTIEQDRFGGAVARYPRGKLAMTQGFDLPLYGHIPRGTLEKERLMALWEDVARRAGLGIRYGARLEGARAVPGGFEAETSAGPVRAASILLAIGRRGSPRRLGAPGEDRDKVAYHLDDPAAFAGRHVLVAGGGDSALEAAASLAEAGAVATLCYRGDAFFRARAANRTRVEGLAAAGALTVLLGAEVMEIAEKSVTVRVGDEVRALPNDRVIVAIGGDPPAALLRGLGVETDIKHGEA